MEACRSCLQVIAACSLRQALKSLSITNLRLCELVFVVTAPRLKRFPRHMLQEYALRRRCVQEAAYNLGRAAHQLGLLHLAVPLYERALAAGKKFTLHSAVLLSEQGIVCAFMALTLQRMCRTRTCRLQTFSQGTNMSVQCSSWDMLAGVLTLPLASSQSHPRAKPSTTCAARLPTTWHRSMRPRGRWGWHDRSSGSM